MATLVKLVKANTTPAIVEAVGKVAIIYALTVVLVLVPDLQAIDLIPFFKFDAIHAADAVEDPLNVAVVAKFLYIILRLLAILILN